MNKIDWVYWIVIALILICFIVAAVTGCAVFQPKPKLIPIVAPSPAIQLWQAVKNSNWLVTVSILGIAGGIFATLNGQKWGIAFVISCCVSLFMVLAVARFAWWMAVCGLVGSVTICIASILSRKRALVEIIRGVQIYRNKTIEHDDLDSDLNKAQKSKSTRKLVKKIKGEI